MRWKADRQKPTWLPNSQCNRANPPPLEPKPRSGMLPGRSCESISSHVTGLLTLLLSTLIGLSARSIKPAEERKAVALARLPVWLGYILLLAAFVHFGVMQVCAGCSTGRSRSACTVTSLTCRDSSLSKGTNSSKRPSPRPPHLSSTCSGPQSIVVVSRLADSLLIVGFSSSSAGRKSPHRPFSTSRDS